MSAAPPIEAPRPSWEDLLAEGERLRADAIWLMRRARQSGLRLRRHEWMGGEFRSRRQVRRPATGLSLASEIWSWSHGALWAREEPQCRSFSPRLPALGAFEPELRALADRARSLVDRMHARQEAARAAAAADLAHEIDDLEDLFEAQPGRRARTESQ
jgi:hypothetical protein